MTDVAVQAEAAEIPPTKAGAPGERRRYDRSIIEGPLQPAVWKLAWPTMLTHIIGGGVLVARFAGAGDEEMVDRTVYQAFLTAIGLSIGIMAPLGFFLSPILLDLVHATPQVKAEALPFIRIMFGCSSGMLVFYMLGGALRSAGDARTPMVLGIALTVLNIVLNVILIRGLGPIPAFGTAGAAMGTSIAGGLVAFYALWKLTRGGWVVSFPKGGPWKPDWEIIKRLFRLGRRPGLRAE